MWAGQSVFDFLKSSGIVIVLIYSGGEGRAKKEEEGKGKQVERKKVGIRE